MNGKTSIKAKLGKLAELRGERERILDDQEQKIDALLPEEVRREIAAVRAEFGDLIVAADRSINALTWAIKTEVVTLRESVACDDLIAEYCSGAVLWNNEALDGYAAAHLEIRKFRAIGKPSVAIQSHKNGSEP